ncbi:YjbF family lipoprotein [Algiphilus sp. W345]|uniref:YjbF family lipoprotein n=1 Tax=Banduia mediterranea TaxID=3075609 RepID=A0ABU2WG33_9GAMM|nr:YjbF family lipoprotein [Algiphilus sp. W345]MDT0496231.1 YjbF family lipoprotein [Algiphilus sp. W345]
MSLNRRDFLGLAGAGLVAGCSANSSARLAYETLKAAYWTPRTYSLSAEEILAIPYSAMGFWAGNNPKAVLIMETLEPPYRATWRSEDRVLIETRNGLIASTAGLPNDLGRFEYSGIPVLGLEAISQLEGRPLNGTLDMLEPREYGVPFQARFEMGAETDLAILGLEHRVVPVVENLNFPTRRSKLTNHYWFRRSDGVAIAGRRSFHEDAPALNWERLLKTA